MAGCFGVLSLAYSRNVSDGGVCDPVFLAEIRIGICDNWLAVSWLVRLIEDRDDLAGTCEAGVH